MHEAKAGDVAPMSKILDVVAVTGTDDPHGLVLDDVKGLELVVGASLPDGTQVFHPGANVGFVESGESRASDEGAGAVKQGEGSFGVSGDALNVGAPWEGGWEGETDDCCSEWFGNGGVAEE
jgi:hypothetical protein